VNLKLTFPGAAAGGDLEGRNPSPAKSNFFLGGSARWRSGVPAFGSVRWGGLYPGIALRVRGLDGEMAIAIEAGPGADLRRIRLRVEGADRLVEHADGSLVATTAVGDVALPRFLLNGRTVPIRAAGAPLARAGDGPPRSSPPASTAPGLGYGTYLGAGQDDLAWRVALGRDGSIYVAGQTFSPGFPTTPGAFDTTYNNGQFGGDAFVSRLDPTGATLVYSTFLGGSDTDWAAAVALGPGGVVYVAGYTYARDFPTTPGSYSPAFNGGCCDGFVTELTADGSALVFSTYLGGDSFEDIGGMALGHGGTVFVTGQTLSADFPTTPGAFDRVINNNGLELYTDAWVASLSPDGSRLTYGSFLGGTYNDYGHAVAITSTSDVYVAGQTASLDFPTTVGAVQRQLGGHDDGFVTRLHAGPGGVPFSTYLGGTDEDDVRAMVVGKDGDAYVTGPTASPNFPVTPGSYDPTINSFIFSDAFATRVDATGTSLTYSTFLGGNDSDFGEDLTLAPDGSLWLTGTTYSNNFPHTSNAYDPTLGGPADAFLAGLDPTGSSLVYSSFLGGTARVIDSGFGILRVPGQAAFYVSGETFSTDFPTTPGAYDTTYNGGFDGFLASIGVGGGPPP
jgi:hypothetical protein